MKKLFSVALAAMMVLSLAACGQNKGDLVMATNAEFPPYEYHEGDKIVGIDVEICQAIADEMGRNLVIEDMAFDSVITSVYSGKADIGAAGLTITEDRLKNINFSTPYATAAQVIIVPEGSDITTPDDLVGKKIGVQLGTTGDIYAEDIEDATLERYNKGFEAIQALAQGKIDAVIIDNEPAKSYVAANEGLAILDTEYTVEDYAICFAKENTELMDAVDGALKELIEDGSVQKIVDKYIPAE